MPSGIALLIYSFVVIFKYIGILTVYTVVTTFIKIGLLATFDTPRAQASAI